MIARIAPALLVVLLAGAVLLRTDAGLSLPNADDAAVVQLTEVLDALPDEALVLVGFDPDIGTYAEIRPTVRSLLADLLNRGARVAFVSLTPEGRALALAELRRMDEREANPRQIIDLGFVPGAEAALVALAHEIEGGSSDPVTTALPDGVSLSDLALGLVVGGIDLGPRSWVEQLLPRTDAVDLVAVAPAVLLPELQPYTESGQLEALLATPRDGAAYRASADLGRLERMVDTSSVPSAPAILVGLLVAVAVLGQAVAARVGRMAHAGRGGEAA